ncbi:tyrosine-type recombinase/integrase [Streptomyces pluripotens]|nr:tyrosine-type recombinase/integrase [Streptomyces pluripotens]
MEAQEKLTLVTAQVLKGAALPDESWRLDQYLDHWLSTAKRRPLTLRRHESIVRLHLKPGLGHYKLTQLSIHTVQSFINQLADDGTTTATIHQARKVLSAALTYAMRQELITRNVARLVQMPKYKPKEAEHWTTEEAARFLEASRPDPLYPAFLLLVMYGLRRGEVLGIRWRDVNFADGVLHIRQQVQRINGVLQQVDLKTDTSVRDEPLLTTVADKLLAHKHEQEAARLLAGDNWQGTGNHDELVFTTRSGRPMESRNLYRSFLRICERYGLRRITVHGMRHTNATTQKKLNVHDRDIQAILGHGDVRTTGIYEHTDMNSKRSALEKVETALLAQAAHDRTRCRQEQPSNKKKLHRIGEVLSGGSSQTRTGDTRLFRPIQAPLHEQLASIDQVMQARTIEWKLGCVAVYLAVNSPSEEDADRRAA